MNKLKYYLAGLFCVCLTFGLSHFAFADSTISGQLLRADGTPIENNTVYIYNDENAYLDYTDDNGIYSITIDTAPISGIYTLKPADYIINYDIGFIFYHYEYFYPQYTTINVTDGANQTINYSFNQHGAVSGKITDLSGNPLNIASIYFWNKNGQPFSGSATTNVLGDYYTTALRSYSDLVTPANGNYQAYVSLNGYLPKYISDVTITDNQVATENVTLTRKSYVSGNIKSKSGSNLSNVVVKAYRLGDNSAYAITQTDANGNYSIELGRTGTYYSFGDFTAKGNYVLQIAGDDTAAYNKTTKNITISSDETNLTKNFTLSRKKGSLSGKIKTAKNKKIKGATIKVNLLSDPSVTSTAYTNSKGKFTFSHLTKGTYQITVSKDGYVNYESYKLKVKKGTKKNVKLAAAGNISGYIFDNITKKPIYGIYVYVAGSDLYAYSDVNGYYIIKNIPVGNKKIYVRSYNYQEQFYSRSSTINNAKIIKVKKNKENKSNNFYLTSYQRQYR